MTIQLKKPSLVEQIKRLAADRAQPTEEVLETAVQAHRDRLEQEAIHAETETFWDLHEELVQKYLGEHIALYRGEVVDHDEDVSRLEKRVHQ